MINQSGAKEELQKFMDRNYLNYGGDAADNQESADNAVEGWANALFEAAKNITPSSTTTSVAKDTFASSASGMESDPSGAVFQSACSSFASTLGGGMAGYTAVPPSSMLDPSLPSGHPGEEDAEQAADFMATKLQSWLSMGTATNIATGVTIPWS